jgi:superfamily II DNA or RNA helicase
MPEQVFKTDWLELTASQKKRIKEIPLEYPEPLVGSLKKHMIENGVLSGDEFSEGETFDNQKIERLVDYASEFPQMVVFARYRAQIAQIASRMAKEGKKVFVLTGDTKDRGELLKEAQEASEYVFICQSSVGSGWELPNCPVAVFASLDFSLVNLVQAQGRISRINNPKRNLYIYLVIKKGVDEHVYKTVVETKMDFHLAQFATARYN